MRAAKPSTQYILSVATSKLAVASTGKGLIKALPLIGVGVSAGINKVLTQRVGARCTTELARRRSMQAETVEADIVDASFNE